MEDKYIMLIAALVLIAIVVAYVMLNKKKVIVKEESSGPEIIYGDMKCPYTVKQVEKYPKAKFVSCDSGECPDFVKGFPTSKFSDGTIVVGYQ